MKQMERPLTLIANLIESNSFNYNHNNIAVLLLSLDKEITSVENTASFLNPCNCNFLPKLQSNDYRHEVELDNNTRKE